MATLFDFSFDHFVTTKLVKVYYAFTLVSLVLMFLVEIGTGIEMLGNPFTRTKGEVMLVLAPFVTGFGLVVARILCEMFIVFFRMAEHLRTLVNSGKGS